MLKEFKEFALRGNVVDLAVGVIIGGAFGKIVTSLVNDLIMPIVGLITGKINFENMFVCLAKVPEGTAITTLEQAKTANIPTLNYGMFLTQIIDFIIMAFVIFLMVRFINKLSNIRKKDAEEVTIEVNTQVCPYCQSEISIAATRCPHCTSQLDSQAVAGQANE